ncbi:MAG TPA: isochorismatase family cysteine hydrolase [Geobacteraceae bacterium]|nr:isochorismatase family cysteine hydrolase [Geobacteraceae bacterium]
MVPYNYALIIIDMQNDFVLPGAPACVAGALATITRIVRLLDFFREKGLPVFHITREYRPDGSDVEITRLRRFLNDRPFVVAGTKGCEIVDGLKPVAGEYRIIKKRFSAFMNTELEFILKRVGATELVICGTQYPNCVRATIFDAISLGYPVINIIDATSAETPQIAEANILDLKNIGVECVSLEEFLGSCHGAVT